METRDSNGTDGDLRLCVPESAGSRTFADSSSDFISLRGDTLNMSGAHLANLCDLERTPTPFVTFTNTRRGGFKEGQIARRLMPGANVRPFPARRTQWRGISFSQREMTREASDLGAASSFRSNRRAAIWKARTALGARFPAFPLCSGGGKQKDPYRRQSVLNCHKPYLMGQIIMRAE